MKNAVIIVPTPAMVGIMDNELPASTNKTHPITTHTRSVQILMYLNLPSFHLDYITIVTASYVETPRSAVIYIADPKHIITIPILCLSATRLKIIASRSNIYLLNFDVLPIIFCPHIFFFFIIIPRKSYRLPQLY